MNIVDNHAHIFPYLGGRSEYESKEIQLTYAQQLISGHHNPVKRLPDYDNIDEESSNMLWDKSRPGIDGKKDVDFRAGKFGRYEWTVDGKDYCKQYMPVSLKDMKASPEFLIAQMDYVGIDMAVLQRGHIYGKLEKFYQDAISRYPDRFIGLCQIDEARAYSENQITELHDAIENLGLRGVYFEPGALFMDNYSHQFDDEIYMNFWKEVDKLGIPLYVQVDRGEFETQMNQWGNVLGRYPSIPLVLSLGLPEEIALSDSPVKIPEELKILVESYEVYLEIGYPISMGRARDYPYPEAHKIILSLYESFGPETLIWGTDIPNVERNCTYAQSLDYVTNYCDFLSRSDREMILGENALNLFTGK